MIIWVAIIFLAVMSILFFKFEHHLRLLRVALLAIVIIFIYLSMSSVISSESVDISSPKGVASAIYVYIGWLGETTTELFQIGKDAGSLAGNAIKVDNPEEADLPQQQESFSLVRWITDKIRKD
jgi:hypothetical protein